jgi:hypothetical protein
LLPFVQLPKQAVVTAAMLKELYHPASKLKWKSSPRATSVQPLEVELATDSFDQPLLTHSRSLAQLLSFFHHGKFNQ